LLPDKDSPDQQTILWALYAGSRHGWIAEQFA
jgi:hypothetical protein